MRTAQPSRPRVLVVDDDADTRGMTADAFRDLCDVVAAGNSAEALSRARSAAPDVMVVDLMLGRESGWDLIRTVQGDPGLRAVPIVVLSGGHQAAPPPDVGPCAAHLTKPCHLAHLRDVVQSLLLAREG